MHYCLTTDTHHTFLDFAYLMDTRNEVDIYQICFFGHLIQSYFQKSRCKNQKYRATSKSLLKCTLPSFLDVLEHRKIIILIPDFLYACRAQNHKEHRDTNKRYLLQYIFKQKLSHFALRLSCRIPHKLKNKEQTQIQHYLLTLVYLLLITVPCTIISNGTLINTCTGQPHRKKLE